MIKVCASESGEGIWDFLGAMGLSVYLREVREVFSPPPQAGGLPFILLMAPTLGLTFL